jgi:hypothetical protein
MRVTHIRGRQPGQFRPQMAWILAAVVAVLASASSCAGQYDCPPVQGRVQASPQLLAAADPCTPPPGQTDASMELKIVAYYHQSVTGHDRHWHPIPPPFDIPIRCGRHGGTFGGYGIYHLRDAARLSGDNGGHSDPLYDKQFEAEIIRTLNADPAKNQALDHNNTRYTVEYSSEKSDCFQQQWWGFRVVVITDKAPDGKMWGLLTAFYLDKAPPTFP